MHHPCSLGACPAFARAGFVLECVFSDTNQSGEGHNVAQVGLDVMGLGPLSKELAPSLAPLCV
jgi:hypothetical protein